MGDLRKKGRRLINIVSLRCAVEKKFTRQSIGKAWDEVKEGHFAVFAIDDGEPKKFLVPLNYLNHPLFVKLLREAEEEYGFDQRDVLLLPCSANDLKTLLH